jgi:predicted aspartyl protease
MIVRLLTAATCIAAGLLTAAPASAACSLMTQPIQVAMQGLRPIVTAKVNGREGRFLLDSGAGINALNSKFAAELKLSPVGMARTGSHLDMDAATAIEGFAGKPTINGLVKASRFDFADASFRDVPFMATDRVGDVDGILGQAFLRVADVEYDFAASKLQLVKAVGCQGANMAYWAKDGQAYSVLPLEWIDRDRPHTEAAVYVNGVRMRAAFDTGSGITFITENAAARAGVKTTDPRVQPAGVVQGVDAAAKTWVATFASVKIGDEEVKNTGMVIAQSDSIGFDVLLGIDFFTSHHVYVANSQEKIFFTYEGGPVFRTPRIQTCQASEAGSDATARSPCAGPSRPSTPIRVSPTP